MNSFGGEKTISKEEKEISFRRDNLYDEFVFFLFNFGPSSADCIEVSAMAKPTILKPSCP